MADEPPIDSRAGDERHREDLASSVPISASEARPPRTAIGPPFISDRVIARLGGASHRHHRDCIHNLPPDEQIAARGRTRQWWEAMGLSEPVQITPDEWEMDDAE